MLVVVLVVELVVELVVVLAVELVVALVVVLVVVLVAVLVVALVVGLVVELVVVLVVAESHNCLPSIHQHMRNILSLCYTFLSSGRFLLSISCDHTSPLNNRPDIHMYHPLPSISHYFDTLHMVPLLHTAIISVYCKTGFNKLVLYTFNNFSIKNFPIKTSKILN